MKLLIITQKVDINDDVLGAIHGWIKKFSEKFDFVNVICLQKGQFDLPTNIEVWSLGKEKGRQSKLKYLFRFYKYIWQLRKEYDVVFVHMNLEYVLLAGLLWRFWKKKVALWFSHKKGSFLRRVALLFVHRLFSVSKDSFVNYKSKKFRAMGHGIDADFFKCDSARRNSEKVKKIITVGRLSPVKRCEVLVKAVRHLVRENGEENFVIEFIGSGGSEKDKEYVIQLKKMVKDFGIEKQIKFVGPVPNNKILTHLCEADIFISMQQIGGLGKSTLEAMSCGVLAIVCTPSLNPYLGGARDYLYYDGSFTDLADKIKMCLNLDQGKKDELSSLMRNIVVEHHNLDNLINKIRDEFESLYK